MKKLYRYNSETVFQNGDEALSYYLKNIKQTCEGFDDWLGTLETLEKKDKKDNKAMAAVYILSKYCHGRQCEHCIFTMEFCEAIGLCNKEIEKWRDSK